MNGTIILDTILSDIPFIYVYLSWNAFNWLHIENHIEIQKKKEKKKIEAKI